MLATTCSLVLAAAGAGLTSTFSEQTDLSNPMMVEFHVGKIVLVILLAGTHSRRTLELGARSRSADCGRDHGDDSIRFPGTCPYAQWSRLSTSQCLQVATCMEMLAEIAEGTMTTTLLSLFVA